MSNGVNKVLIIGNLGSDPEIKYTKAGDPVANLSIATSESWKDKNSGDLQEKVGKDRYTTEVVAKEMTMLDSRSTSQAQENSPKVESEKPKDDFEEDIPF